MVGRIVRIVEGPHYGELGVVVHNHGVKLVIKPVSEDAFWEKAALMTDSVELVEDVEEESPESFIQGETLARKSPTQEIRTVLESIEMDIGVIRRELESAESEKASWKQRSLALEKRESELVNELGAVKSQLRAAQEALAVGSNMVTCPQCDEYIADGSHSLGCKYLPAVQAAEAVFQDLIEDT